MALCDLAVYLMADILRLGKSIDEEDRNVHELSKKLPFLNFQHCQMST